ncbi:unnamed protein product [Prorocentrum cordatum]|uniref:Uncharacterized protein n=1 Tax=Prorocentrum cordatum TaxID=2364126 RepID=A0ABN9R6P1_9DINO|nr:unnamed protein product [Polarella glacialis]
MGKEDWWPNGRGNGGGYQRRDANADKNYSGNSGYDGRSTTYVHSALNEARSMQQAFVRRETEREERRQHKSMMSAIRGTVIDTVRDLFGGSVQGKDKKRKKDKKSKTSIWKALFSKEETNKPLKLLRLAKKRVLARNSSDSSTLSSTTTSSPNASSGNRSFQELKQIIKNKEKRDNNNLKQIAAQLAKGNQKNDFMTSGIDLKKLVALIGAQGDGKGSSAAPDNALKMIAGMIQNSDKNPEESMKTFMKCLSEVQASSPTIKPKKKLKLPEDDGEDKSEKMLPGVSRAEWPSTAEAWLKCFNERPEITLDRLDKVLKSSDLPAGGRDNITKVKKLLNKLESLQ